MCAYYLLICLLVCNECDWILTCCIIMQVILLPKMRLFKDLFQITNVVELPYYVIVYIIIWVDIMRWNGKYWSAQNWWILES